MQISHQLAYDLVAANTESEDLSPKPKTSASASSAPVEIRDTFTSKAAEASVSDVGYTVSLTSAQPSDRAQKLAALKASIDAGEYKVPAHVLADSIIKRMKTSSAE